MKMEKMKQMEIAWNEELGAENAKSKMERDAEALASYPTGVRISTDHVLKAPSEWRDVPYDTDWDAHPAKKIAANERQVAGCHYKNMKVQPWDVIDSMPHAQAIGFYRGNALKYIMRAGEKGPVREDYEKAVHYLEKLLEILT